MKAARAIPWDESFFLMWGRSKVVLGQITLSTWTFVLRWLKWCLAAAAIVTGVIWLAPVLVERFVVEKERWITRSISSTATREEKAQQTIAADASQLLKKPDLEKSVEMIGRLEMRQLVLREHLAAAESRQENVADAAKLKTLQEKNNGVLAQMQASATRLRQERIQEMALKEAQNNWEAHRGRLQALVTKAEGLAAQTVPGLGSALEKWIITCETWLRDSSDRNVEIARLRPDPRLGDAVNEHYALSARVEAAEDRMRKLIEDARTKNEAWKQAQKLQILLAEARDLLAEAKSLPFISSMTEGQMVNGAARLENWLRQTRGCIERLSTAEKAGSTEAREPKTGLESQAKAVEALLAANHERLLKVRHAALLQDAKTWIEEGQELIRQAEAAVSISDMQSREYGLKSWKDKASQWVKRLSAEAAPSDDVGTKDIAEAEALALAALGALAARIKQAEDQRTVEQKQLRARQAAENLLDGPAALYFLGGLRTWKDIQSAAEKLAPGRKRGEELLARIMRLSPETTSFWQIVTNSATSYRTELDSLEGEHHHKEASEIHSRLEDYQKDLNGQISSLAEDEWPGSQEVRQKLLSRRNEVSVLLAFVEEQEAWWRTVPFEEFKRHLSANAVAMNAVRQQWLMTGLQWGIVLLTVFVLVSKLLRMMKRSSSEKGFNELKGVADTWPALGLFLCPNDRPNAYPAEVNKAAIDRLKELGRPQAPEETAEITSLLDKLYTQWASANAKVADDVAESINRLRKSLRNELGHKAGN